MRADECKKQGFYNYAQQALRAHSLSVGSIMVLPPIHWLLLDAHQVLDKIPLGPVRRVVCWAAALTSLRHAGLADVRVGVVQRCQSEQEVCENTVKIRFKKGDD